MAKLVYDIFYGQSLKYIIFLMIFLIGFWSCIRKLSGKNIRYYTVWKIINIFGGIIIGVVILMTTLSSRSNSVAELILVPLHSFLEAKTQPEIYRSMLMNVFLFFPLGLTLPFALPEKWNRKALLTIAFAFILSFVIEFLQFHYHLGRAETDDVICNTLGAAIGTLSYTLERKFFNK